MRGSIVAVLFLCACGPGSGRSGIDASGSGSQGDASGGGGGGGGGGGSGSGGSYTVYAHSNTVLYTVDLQAKSLSVVGNFNAPNSDVITDLAVAPDNTIYVISNTKLYTADANDGHVTQVGTLAACGMKGVALTTLPNGEIWEGDFKGALCKIDISGGTPVVGAPVMMGSNMALAGDLVGTDDGTVYGTAYSLSGTATSNNSLVKINMQTGAVTMVGNTMQGNLFGTAASNGQIIGFTHDGSGKVVSINPMTGAPTPFATFKDPTTMQPISFAGAGVSSLVVVIQ